MVKQPTKITKEECSRVIKDLKSSQIKIHEEYDDAVFFKTKGNMIACFFDKGKQPGCVIAPFNRYNPKEVMLSDDVVRKAHFTSLNQFKALINMVVLEEEQMKRMN